MTRNACPWKSSRSALDPLVRSLWNDRPLNTWKTSRRLKVLLKCALLLRRLCAQDLGGRHGLDVHDDHAHRGAARRRRRLRAFLRHEKLSLAMQMATVSHHSWHRAGRADASTQTMTHTDAATCAATAAPAPVFEYVAPAPVIECIAPAP